ncbi:MAG: uracil phosphoribosyltransferase [Candidatus Ancillula sp.]|jgi:uracil phosphoribosyltransferase|nr:uracil phosphoribosyltransferase [Candidatus Ancillula sp.]
MKFVILDHPLISHKHSILRDENTPSMIFRSTITELTMLATYEATKNLDTHEVEIRTPVAAMKCQQLTVNPRPLVVPILRAGLGMLEGMTRMIPSSEVGFLGMKRDEESLLPETYTERLPEDLRGRQCYLIDPMLATGGSLADGIEYLYKRGARDITCINIVAAPEGRSLLEKRFSAVPDLDLKIFVTAMDEKLNEVGYIVPGLGDAGDRLYGPY